MTKDLGLEYTKNSQKSPVKKIQLRDFPGVQWLRPYASTAGVIDSVLAGELGSRMLCSAAKKNCFNSIKNWGRNINEHFTNENP